MQAFTGLRGHEEEEEEEGGEPGHTQQEEGQTASGHKMTDMTEKGTRRVLVLIAFG